MTDLPEPLTPADCDTRGLPFMPLDCIRLLDSDLFAISTGDEFKAAFSLWAKSWNQIPAASLPSDERVLAHLSGAGKDWVNVKEVAMRGWVLCSDGRWYHPVVAEKAIEAMSMRVNFNADKEEKLSRQKLWREKQRSMSKVLRQINVAVPESATSKQLEELFEKHGLKAIGNDECDASATKCDASATKCDVSVRQSATSQCDAADVLATCKTGTGTGTVQEEESTFTHSTLNPAREVFVPEPENPKPRNRRPPPNLAAVMDAAGMIEIPKDWKTTLEMWRDDGISLENQILPAIRMAATEHREAGGKQPWALKFFDIAVRRKAEIDQRDIARFERITESYANEPPHPAELIEERKNAEAEQ